MKPLDSDFGYSGTLTSHQRRTSPRRAARKDARTRIYRVILGPGVSRDPKGDPLMNDSRKLPEHWTQSDALHVMLQDWNKAHFPRKTALRLIEEWNKIAKGATLTVDQIEREAISA